jgi:hypothetical protein
MEDVLMELLWDLAIAVFGPIVGGEDLRRDGPPGSSHWLRAHHRWNVVMRQTEEISGIRVAGLSRRWRRAVLEVLPEHSHVTYRCRWRARRHIITPTSFRRSAVRLPERREVSRFRQIFPIQVDGAHCEVAVWSRDVQPLKESLDATAGPGVG